MSDLTWVTMESGVWRSVCGRYVILAVALPERPARTVYQARKVDPHMAAARPLEASVGILLKECLSLWNSDNGLDSAESACERDLWCVEHPLNVPDDHPAAALSGFWWPLGGGGRGALAVVWEDGRLVAQILGASRGDGDKVQIGEYTRIDLTALGVQASPPALPTRVEHPAQCAGCNVPAGTPHRDGCSHARCLTTRGQRLACEVFGGSPVAGMEALARGGDGQAEFETYFKAPLDHDCGRDVYQGG